MMGKKRKFSKQPISTGIVQKYHHTAKTIGESDSEGLGSSGRADTEMTVSEDSCVPKTNCISLNAVGYNAFGVPLKVMSFSKLSLSQIKDLEVQFRNELEQVRALQKKVSNMCSNGLSPLNDGKKKPHLENFHLVPKVHAAKGKRPAPTGYFELPKQTPPLNSLNAMLMKQCKTLLGRLMSHQHSWVFNTPVDAVKLNIPDYFTIIKNPMDLGTVKHKLASSRYSNVREFCADVRLTFSNAIKYNPSGNDVHFMATTLSKFFEIRWKPIEKKIPAPLHIESVPSRSVLDTEPKDADPISIKKTTTTVSNKITREPVKRLMTDEEKRNLSIKLEALLGELPENIIDFLKHRSFNENQTNEDEIEIDIDALSSDTLLTLQKLLDDYVLEKQKKQEKVQLSKAELSNGSRFNNSSMQLCKVNDPMDEDVDIVDEDPPMLSYPPVEIERDTVVRSGKYSSSSESGSSSSGSDSTSSSGSESNGAKVSVCAHIAMEALGPAANEKSDIVDPSTENQTLDGLGQAEQTSQSKPLSDETGDNKDGEIAPFERQVSPDKIYRAALLRSRFADTILKAREKTLEKSEKLNPEKLRLEKQELERQQREEKARLLEEAKAAEEARRKAEGEAAKRKRESEREAARLALQQMEKTVEINENCELMEDLEMFRGVAGEQLSSLIDDRSPQHSRGVVCSFKFEGSNNPLEQLGLYMKIDEDEEADFHKSPELDGK